MSSIPIKNVYNMLVYAFKILKSKEYERLNNEDCKNVYDLLASLLVSGTHVLIKRGLLKSYVNQTEELSAIRGKVNIAKSLGNLSFQNAKAVCDFDEFSSNIYFNQVIKATLLYLKEKDIEKNIKRDVVKVLLYFSEIDTIRLAAVKWESFAFNRNNAHYDIILYFCKLVWKDAIANQDSGKKDFRTIEERLLPSLFEHFIYAFYKKHLPYSVFFQQQIKWSADNSDMLPKMSADTIIESDSQELIIDTKFYSKSLQSNRFSDNQSVISTNLYQIFAYVKNEKAHTYKSVSGLLLYPKIDITLEKSYCIDGQMFHIRTIDLNQDFREISKNLIQMINNVIYGDEAERYD